MFGTQQEVDDFGSTLGNAPDGTKSAIAQQAIGQIRDSDQKVATIAGAARQLSASQQADFITQAGLAPPSPQANDSLWKYLISALIFIIIGCLLVLVFKDNLTDRDYVKTVISLCLGAIIGLVSPASVKSATSPKAAPTLSPLASNN
jgi:hypothetical protein